MFSGGNVNNTTQYDSNANKSILNDSSVMDHGRMAKIMNDPIEKIVSNLGKYQSNPP
jgi:hypothetical protein